MVAGGAYVLKMVKLVLGFIMEGVFAVIFVPGMG